ncbi:MAG: ferredoxin--NADP reductase [bacterium]|nr:ferredoxin--NADP reductase [bacterium]
MPQNLLTNAVVTQKIEVTPELIILQVTPEGWELPAFEAGQFAVLGLPGSAPRSTWSDPEDETPEPDKLIRRAYSIASSSVAREFMEFYITVVRSGALTPRLFALEMGDRVWLGPKMTGMFTLEQVPEEAHLLLVATGTGLAPYMSMLRTHLSSQSRRRFAVLHGARHSWDLGYRSELTTMQQLCPNFTYLSLISRPAREPVAWSGITGYVQDLWTGGHLDRAWGFHPTAGDTHVFLCGNPQMCEDMLSLLEQEGFKEQTRKQDGVVHVERYW